MQEVPIPNGKELRYRCGVRGCHAPGKTYSIVTIYDHLARHYARRTMSNDHFNFRCIKCGTFHYHYGLTMWCACTERNGTENECVRLGSGYSRQVAHRHNEFYGYLKLHVVPVFVTKEANQTDRSNLFSTPERAEEVESAIMRSPSEYNDGTPRTPLVEDDEENDEPAYARVFRSISRKGSVASVQIGSGNAHEERCDRRGDATPRRASTVRSPTWRSRQAQLLEGSPPRPPTTAKVGRRPKSPLLPSCSQPCSSRSSYGSTSYTPNFNSSGNSQRLENLRPLQQPMESSPYSFSQMTRGDEFGSTTTTRPPCPSTPEPAPVPYPPRIPTSSGFPLMNISCGPYQSYSLPLFMGGPAGQYYDPMQLWHPGIPPFTTMPNPQTPHGDRSGSRTTSTAQLNPTSAPARNHPEREGGTKFVEIPPNTTPMKPGGLTPRRKRRSSRRDDSDLK